MLQDQYLEASETIPRPGPVLRSLKLDSRSMQLMLTFLQPIPDVYTWSLNSGAGA